MSFCSECDNIMDAKITKVDDDSEKTRLQYVCLQCNLVVDSKSKDSCVFSIDFNTDNIKKQSFINPYIYEDKTLPIANGIKCPNVNCPSESPKISYIEYDSAKMKYIYICMDCYKAGQDHIW